MTDEPTRTDGFDEPQEPGGPTRPPVGAPPDGEPSARPGPGPEGERDREGDPRCGPRAPGEGRDRRHRARHRQRHGHSHGARKERILHTRISEQLSEEIRRLADEMRVPVSNLVRNVLEEAFSAVESMSGNLGDVLEDVLDGAERASAHYAARRRRREERTRQRPAAWEEEFARDAEAFDLPPEPPSFHAPPERPPMSSEPPSTPERGRAPRDLFEGVVAWQPVVLHAPQPCARTGQPMAAGARAYAAIGPHGLTGLYVREDALPVD